ncbi:MAG: hypothetical protein ABR564_09570 [Candidatus Dormibacteria bacterium]
MATAHPAPDPFDEEIDAMLSDPEVIARLDAIKAKRGSGTLVVHSNDEVREHLRRRGVPVNEPTANG